MYIYIYSLQNTVYKIIQRLQQTYIDVENIQYYNILFGMENFHKRSYDIQ